MRIGPPWTLETITYHWGDAYLISYTRDRWVALRRDNYRFLIADTLDGLEHAIKDDYLHHPVPRDFDLPGATDYLDCTQGERWGNGQDGDDSLDEETLITLTILRAAFSLWAIDYSRQMRAWVARAQNETICENSAVLLCIALALIERKQRQGR